MYIFRLSFKTFKTHLEDYIYYELFIMSYNLKPSKQFTKTSNNF